MRDRWSEGRWLERREGEKEMELGVKENIYI